MKNYNLKAYKKLAKQTQGKYLKLKVTTGVA